MRINLGDMVNHTAAPIWYLAAHGRGECPEVRFSCPSCGSENVKLRTGDEEVYVVSRTDGTYTVGVAKGDTKPDDPQARSIAGITVPMCCAYGHEWMLCIEQEGDGQADMFVLMSDDTYQETFPKAFETWG